MSSSTGSGPGSDTGSGTSVNDDENVLFRNVCPTDLTDIFALEKESYPKDEAASRSQLQYRQHHAAKFFRCAVILHNDDAAAGSRHTQDINPVPDIINSNSTSLNGIGELIGFVTATRCHSFDEESMKVHDPMGKLLAIHSVVVKKQYRNRGMGTRMVRNYIESLKKMELKYGIEKVVLISKKSNLMFYLDCGFCITGKSAIEHGAEQWYDCECEVDLTASKRTVMPGMASGNRASSRRIRSRGKYTYSVVDAFAVSVKPVGNAGNNAGGGGAVKRASITDGGGGSGSGSSGTSHPAGVPLSTSGKGTGNPAAVVVIPNEEATKFDPQSEEDVRWMMTTAREFNLSETAFIWQTKVKPSSSVENIEARSRSLSESNPNANVEVTYNIRYYTCNGTEVDLCGHATLASSLVVFQDLFSKGKRNTSVTFLTKQNVMLKASPVNPNANITIHTSIRIVMEFPSKDLIAMGDGSTEQTQVLHVMKESFFPKLTLDDVAKMVKYVGLDDGGDDLLIELSPEGFAMVPSLPTDIQFTPMTNYAGYKRGIILCCAINSDEANDNPVHGGPGSERIAAITSRVDFMSRFFGPKVGIDEDPVTGSAHCVLGPYFAKQLEKDYVVGLQTSRRGGIVECTLINEDDAGNNVNVVRIAGSAVTTMSGNLYI